MSYASVRYAPAHVIATTLTDITISVLGFFALIALVSIVRIILRREESAWRRLRVGFFIERDRANDIDYEAGFDSDKEDE